MRVTKKSELKKGLPKKTVSLCPECHRLISAEIYEKDGKVMYRKTCPEHGTFEDIYFGDANAYLWLERFAIDGIGLENPQTEVKRGCPFDCGLCPIHTSHTSIANVDLTNRCNLRCPICFANANAAGYVYEPSFEEVVNMLKLLRSEKPVPTPAVQFAGGEPTIYPRFFDVIRAARDLGFPQIQVATNGVKLAAEPDFCQRMLDAGLHTVYLQFDGFKEETYVTARGRPGFLKEKMQAIENCRNTKPRPLATVLVPTVVRGVNDDEVGKIVDFALENLDVIRGVNFQPVSFTGRINQEERLQGRYTIGDLINGLIEQTSYFESYKDFFPVPAGAIISEVISQVTKDPKVAFTTHPHCGAAAYLFRDEKTGEVYSITRFIDVEGLLEEMLEKAEEGAFEKKGKAFAGIAAYRLFKKYVDEKSSPGGLNILKVFKEMVTDSDKKSIGKLHWRALFIGTMHFQDDYNYDVERVKRCAVHYATPDGRIIPFCAYNTGPTYRTEVEKKFSMSIEEWRERNKGLKIDE